MPNRLKTALQKFSTLPDGCISLPVTDIYSEPALSKGDFAVINTKDRNLSDGGLFAIKLSKTTKILVILRLGRCEYNKKNGKIESISLSKYGPDYCWWTDPLNRPHSQEEMEEWRATGRPIPTSDGPFTEDHITSIVIGRAIGKLSGEYAIRAAQAQATADIAWLEVKSAAIAENFDAELYIKLRDQIGQISCIQDTGSAQFLMTALNCEPVGKALDRQEIYEKYSDLFRVASEGQPFTDKLIANYLRENGRVIWYRDGVFTYDSRMPPEIRVRLEHSSKS